MKISNSTQNYINQSYANTASQTANKAAEQAANQERPADESAPTDSINLSSTTRDLQKISAAAETEPENREQLVADLKQQVEANQYTVNAEQVAGKMKSELFPGKHTFNCCAAGICASQVMRPSQAPRNDMRLSSYIG